MHLFFCSGMFGLFITRVFPHRLTSHGPDVIYERIPLMIAEIRKDAQELINNSIEVTRSCTISEFYSTKIFDFLSGPKHFLPHLVESQRPLLQILDRIKDQKRYLNEKEEAYLVELKQLCLDKDHLDYVYALQSLLKGWFRLHIPFSWLLIIYACIHGILAVSFSGGF